MKNILDELKNKYNYDDNLLKAIELIIPLMINKYGENKKDEIFDLFRNIPIFTTNDFSMKVQQEIEDYVIGDVNKNIVSKPANPYGKAPRSYYSYEPIFDDNMNIIDEKRWLVVEDTKDDNYKNLFGTTINIPYFIHELNHAFAMRNPLYNKEGNNIYTKHGLYAYTIEITPIEDGKYMTTVSDENGVINEEGINELYTQEMLNDLFHVSDYEIVKAKLNEIHHIPTSYNSIIIALASKLVKVLGQEKIDALRANNDIQIVDQFNEIASKGEIAKEYLEDYSPYTFFTDKMMEIFQLGLNKLSMSVDEYRIKQCELMLDALAPLCSYQEVYNGTINYERYKEERDKIYNSNKQTK